MNFITVSDPHERSYAVAIACTGQLEDGEREEAEAALDVVLNAVFARNDVTVVDGSCADGDPLLDFWRRQIGRVVHTHPHVASCFADWRGTTLVWHWTKAETLLTRRTNWTPFATRAAWEAGLAAAPPAPPHAPAPGRRR